jgi:hypothetical protein
MRLRLGHQELIWCLEAALRVIKIESVLSCPTQGRRSVWIIGRNVTWGSSSLQQALCDTPAFAVIVADKKRTRKTGEASA